VLRVLWEAGGAVSDDPSPFERAIERCLQTPPVRNLSLRVRFGPNSSKRRIVIAADIAADIDEEAPPSVGADPLLRALRAGAR
jgi:hypothetical protein